MGDVITEFMEDCSDCFLFISKQMSIIIKKDVKQKKMNDQELWSCQKSMYSKKNWKGEEIRFGTE